MAGAAHFHVASPALTQENRDESRKQTQNLRLLSFIRTFRIMDTKKILINFESRASIYDITIGNDLLKTSGLWAKNCLSESVRKTVIVSNKKVFGLYGDKVRQSLTDVGFKISVWLMEDGEEYKNFASLEALLTFFSGNSISRTDAIVALGGGVVGDLTGFAASTYLRGISFLQIPTTLLAMIDSSVGGKTAVNTEFGKNLVGAFYQPKGVLIDVQTLKTLEHRELIAGFCEAIKQAAVGNKKVFRKTAEFLKKYPLNNFAEFLADKNFTAELEKLIFEQILIKAEIVMQDETESVDRKDFKSRKVLNFGHTTAHALERVTDYKYFKHGEAVGYGILIAAELSRRLGICVKDDVDLLNDVVKSVGKLPETGGIKIDEVLKSITLDKKSIGDVVQWILLEEIGKPRIVSSRDIPPSEIKNALIKVLHARKCPKYVNRQRGIKVS